MKLNADMGESFGAWHMGRDADVMAHVDMANVACGFHASDPLTMESTLLLAQQYGVSVGAHPGYPDLVGFGRRSMKCTSAEIRTLILYQVGALSAIAGSIGSQVDYVKPHGALYNDMMKDDGLLATIMAAVASLERAVPLMIQATTRNDHYRTMAQQLGCTLLFEAFADRACHDDGTLVSRSEPGSVFEDRTTILNRARQLTQTGTVTSVSGNTVALSPDTLCVHGDNAASIATVAEIRKVIDAG